MDSLPIRWTMSSWIRPEHRQGRCCWKHEPEGRLEIHQSKHCRFFIVRSKLPSTKILQWRIASIYYIYMLVSNSSVTYCRQTKCASCSTLPWSPVKPAEKGTAFLSPLSSSDLLCDGDPKTSTKNHMVSPEKAQQNTLYHISMYNIINWDI